MTVLVIYTALVRAALIGVGSKVDSPPIVYLLCPPQLDFSLMDFFSFTMCIPNTLDICLHWPLRRVQLVKSWGVHYWGLLQSLLFELAARVSLPEFPGGLRSFRQSFCCLYLTFWEEAPKWSEEIEGYSRVTWYLGLVSISWWSPYCLRIASSLSSLLLGILWSFWMDWLATASNVPGSFILAFWGYILVTNNFSWDFTPWQPTGLLWWLSFLRFCEERKINVDVIEERLVLFFVLNHFQLTMSRSDFVLKIT